MEKITTCILIDDDIDEHELFQMAISDCPFRVSCTCFMSCTEATKYLENKGIYSPDFVFMDWHLSYMEGMDCFSNLAQLSKLLTSKIFIYSGMPELSQTLGSQLIGDIRFLAKQNSTAALTNELVGIFQNF